MRRWRCQAAWLFSALAELVVAADVPPLAPPAGASSVIRDTAANHWALVAAENGHRSLWVLPAQTPNAWTAATIADLPPGEWTELEANADATITARQARGAVTFDPRAKVPRAQVGIPVADPAATPWRTIARMPASNHDLAAAVLAGRVYVAGGLSAEWGFPPRSHGFDQLLAFEPRAATWKAVARFATPRIFCATAAFDGRVWIMGGDTLAPDGERRATTLVQCFDPATGALTNGPELPVAQAAPLALFARGRLYVIGATSKDTRGRMDSIGSGETRWRREPDAFPQMSALAGAALDERLYVCVPQRGLTVFDPATGHWDTIPGPAAPRSAQVAAWRGELWIVGGRDIREQNATQIFNPRARTWRQGPSLPRPLAWGAAAVVDDQLFVTGGAGGTSYSDRTFALSADAIPPARPESGPSALPPWDNSALAHTGGATPPFTTGRVYPGIKLRRPVTIALVPNPPTGSTPRMLVAESDGAVLTFRDEPNPSGAEPMLNLPAHFRNATQTYQLAFHPRYPATPHVFVLYNRLQPKPSENVLARFTVTQFEPPLVDPASERVLLRWPSDGHNGGDLKFGPDNFLYVSVGDRSSPGDPNNLGQRVDLIAGGILRLDVDRSDDGKNYAVPRDNPFVDRPSTRPEFWAYGLRNPWRMSFAPTGELWVGDNGDDSWESIHLVRRAANYGWSAFEGHHPFKRTLALAGPTPRVTPPVIELPHSEARSVIGGLVYRGKQLPGLVDHYVFGDYVTGGLWAFRWDGAAAKDFRKIADTGGRPVSFGAGRDGELLMVWLDGQIRRLEAAPAAAQVARAAFPRQLSATGLFASTRELAPAAGVMPYEINAALWSDGATARRLMAIPPGQTIGFSDTRAWKMPEGTALARTLEWPTARGPQRIETQVMHLAGGRWQFYTYAWNDAQTDAELVPAEGATRPLPNVEGRTWVFAGRGECALCHTAQSDHALGLSTTQLNREADYSAMGGRIENQIARLAASGRLGTANPPTPGEWPHTADPGNLAESLERRARAYLNVNCAHCHRPDGVGGRAAFQLMESLPLARTGLIGGRPLVPLLGAEARLIVPGAPDRSELFHRLSTRGGGRMPLVGSHETDEAGVALVREWIASLGAPATPAENRP